MAFKRVCVYVSVYIDCCHSVRTTRLRMTRVINWCKSATRLRGLSAKLLRKPLTSPTWQQSKLFAFYDFT